MSLGQTKSEIAQRCIDCGKKQKELVKAVNDKGFKISYNAFVKISNGFNGHPKQEALEDTIEEVFKDWEKLNVD